MYTHTSFHSSKFILTFSHFFQLAYPRIKYWGGGVNFKPETEWLFIMYYKYVSSSSFFFFRSSCNQITEYSYKLFRISLFEVFNFTGKFHRRGNEKGTNFFYEYNVQFMNNLHKTSRMYVFVYLLLFYEGFYEKIFSFTFSP